MNVMPIKHKMTWTPTIIVSTIAALVIIVALREAIAQILINDKFAAFFGSLLGVIGAVGLWVASSIRDRREKIEEQVRFEFAIWTELNFVAFISLDEIATWETITIEPTGLEEGFRKTLPRIIEGIQLAVISNNLSRISSFEPLVAGNIIGALGRLRELRQTTIALYELEKGLSEQIETSRTLKGKTQAELDSEFSDALKRQYKSRLAVVKKIAKISEVTFLASVQLDRNSMLSRMHESALGEEDLEARQFKIARLLETCAKYKAK
jgi:hypothetical protein